MEKRSRRFLGLVGIAAALAGARSLLARRGAQSSTVVDRRSQPDAEALRALANGQAERIGFDLNTLREEHESTFKPIVEYLTYIQVQRGENESLVFVRHRDLDALAALAGETREGFMEEFQKMGVILSMN